VELVFRYFVQNADGFGPKIIESSKKVKEQLMKEFPVLRLLWVPFVLLKCISSKPSPQLSTVEFNALYALFNSTNGDNWHWVNQSGAVPWNFHIPNVNPCSDNWEGLLCKCGVQQCNVEIIELNHHNLTGSLPESMGDFPQLSLLELRGNNLSSVIPSNIGQLTKLEDLDLSFNYFEGEIPSSLGGLPNLQIFNVDANSLSSIAEGFYNCSQLRTLSIVNNSLSGTLSNRIGNLTNLQYFNIYGNSLNSTLPASLGNLISLQSLDLSHNYFYSTIPKEIGKLANLTFFISDSTFFSGPLPKEIGNLHHLQTLSLQMNQLFGSLPYSMGQMSSLRELILNNNFLTGTIPSSFTNLTDLFAFYLEVNSFHGNVSVMKSFNKLLLSQINNNFFSGTLVGTLDNIDEMLYLDVGSNTFDSKLPYSPSWKALINIEFSSNYFTGGITENFKQLPALNYFIAQGNYLTGTLSDHLLMNCTRFALLALSFNLFSGSIPHLTSSFPQFDQFYLDNNFLSGRIPDDLSFMENLAIFSVFANQLTGTVPISSISRLKYLVQIVLEQNSLSGPVTNIFNATYQRILNTIDISNNQFTGTIPLSLVSLPKLQGLILSTNCLQGSIPEELCQIEDLKSLSLDGLATASNCRVNLFPGLESIFDSFVLKHYMEGSIPSCLLEMKNIQLLHLSGNGLTGTLPANVDISLPLYDLSFSHNLLTGTVPRIYQNHSWLSFDISYNKITGTLEPSFYVYEELTTTFSFEINRLSGEIPSSLIDSESISILDGNIFACDFSGSNLPQNDPNYSTYSCGSDNVNYVLYAWLVGLFLLLPLVLLVYWRLLKVTSEANSEERVTYISSLKAIARQLILWKDELKRDLQFPNEEIIAVMSSTRGTLFTRTGTIRNNLYRLSVFFSETRKTFIVLMLYCIVIVLPLDSVLKINYSSYTVEYAWTVSGMLLEGEVPAILLFLSLFFFIVLTQYLFKRLIHIIKNQSAAAQRFNVNAEEPKITAASKSNEASLKNDDALDEQRRSVISENFGEIFSVYFTVFLFNLFIMGIVDFSYVYIVITYDSVTISLAAVALAVFRLITNNMLLWNAVPLVLNTFIKFKWIRLSSFALNSPAKADNNGLSVNATGSASNASVPVIEISSIFQIIHHYSPGDISFLQNIVLFNNVVIPCLAILFILPDCFYNALFAPGEVNSSYSYQSCNQYYLHNNVGHVCSDKWQSITYFPPYIYSYQCSSKIIINYVPVYIFMFLFVGVLLPLSEVGLKLIYEFCKAKISKGLMSSSSIIYYVVSQLLPVKFKGPSEHPLPDDQSTPSATNPMIENGLSSLTDVHSPSSKGLSENGSTYGSEPKSARSLFSKAKLTIQINSYLAIMISFGALFPPLALLACFTIVVVTNYEEIVLGNLLTEIRANKLIYHEMKINQECYHIEEGINLTLWSTLFVSCCLYSYIIFDTMGDENGWEAALPMTIIMFCLPFLLFLTNYAVAKFHCVLFSFRNNVPSEVRNVSQEPGSADIDNDEIAGERDDSNNRSFYRQSRMISDIQMASMDSTVLGKNS
jgi:Leucine-rich repeat (LRR) protein